MEKQIQLPPIVPLVYKGERVLTNCQLAELFGVTERSITHIYGRHKSALAKGIDYYDLRGKAFGDFKAENSIVTKRSKMVDPKLVDGTIINDYQPEMVDPKLVDGTTNNGIQPKMGLTPVQDGTTNPVTNADSGKTAADYIKGAVIKIWTKGGVFKLSKHFHTDNAKLIYISLTQGYFYTEPASLPPVKENQDDGASIYAFEMSNGTVKIGISNNVPYRAKDVEYRTRLKVTNVFYLTVNSRRKAFDVEVALHKHFAPQCVQREFFLIDFEEACAQIKMIINEPEIEEQDEYPLITNTDNADSQFDKLKFLIEQTEDKILKEKLIRVAAKLILGKDF